MVGVTIRRDVKVHIPESSAAEMAGRRLLARAAKYMYYGPRGCRTARRNKKHNNHIQERAGGGLRGGAFGASISPSIENIVDLVHSAAVLETTTNTLTLTAAAAAHTGSSMQS